MAKSNAQQSQVQISATHPLSTGGILQRQCETCGKHTIAGEACADCERAEGTVQRSMERAGQGGGVEETKPKAGFQHNFSGVPIRRKAGLRVQTKLTVGAVGDKYEQEADRVAEQVMRMPEPDEEKAVSASMPSAIQRLPLAGNASVHRQAEDVLLEKKEEEERPDLQRQEIARDLDEPKEEIVQAKESVGETPQVTTGIEERLAARRGQGEPLPETTRSFMETRFGQDFGQVRVHTGGEAARLSKELRAQAFTHRQDVYFGSGRYSPESIKGKRLLAHELTHVVQQSATGTIEPSSTPSLQKDGDETGPRLLQSTQALKIAIAANNVSGVVEALRGHTIADLRVLKDAVYRDLSVELDRWLVSRVNSVNYMREAARWIGFGTGRNTSAFLAEDALRILWPAMSLLERLEAYSETFREIETAQLDVIRASSNQERAAARRQPTKLETIYSRMNPEEEYKARLLIDPIEGYTATSQLISRASSWTGDTEDPVFDAILALSPSERKSIWENHSNALSSLVWPAKLNLIRLMATGRTTQAAQANPQSPEAQSTEAQALIARLRLATEGRIDDTKGIQTVVNQAASLLRERQTLSAELRSSGLAAKRKVQIERRLGELGDLDALISLAPQTSQARSKSIMWRLSEAASSPDQFAQWAQTASGMGSVGTSLPVTSTTGTTTNSSSSVSTTPSVSVGTRQRFLIAKQRILLSAGTFSVDNEAIESAIVGLRAPTITTNETNETLSPRQREQRQTQANNQLRQQLLEDPEVRTVLNRLSRQGPAGGIYVSSIERLASADRFTELLNDFGDAVNRADYGEVFRLALVFARRPEWRSRFEATGREFASAYSRIQGEQREIVQTILRTRQVPINKVLAYTGDADTLKRILSQLNELQRGRLRLGYWLSREQPAADSLTDDAKNALTEFRDFETRLQQSQTLMSTNHTGVQDVLDAALGSAPTESEMRSGAGRFRAAGLLYHRQKERLGLDVGLSATFTETDETMVAAAREYAALWERVRGQGELSAVDFAALTSLHSRFEQRSQDFTVASQTVSEVASMIASTAAAIIVVAATGGAATPGVLAAAAATGAGTRLMAREMFGGDYYNPASEAGARDALLGALDGALAILGSSLAAKGTELLGLGGSTLTRGAARVGGEAVEQASQSLTRRVAAGAVEASIDDAFSGSISEAVMTMTDPQAWRRGIWQGLSQVGQAAILGGLTGLGTGAIIGGSLPVVGAGIRRVRTASGTSSTGEFSSWQDSLNSETQKLLNDNPALARVYAEMDPEARRLLTLCSSPCIPDFADEISGLGDRIKAIIAKAELPDNHLGLRQLFHGASSAEALDSLVKKIEGLAQRVDKDTFLQLLSNTNQLGRLLGEISHTDELGDILERVLRDNEIRDTNQLINLIERYNKVRKATLADVEQLAEGGKGPALSRALYGEGGIGVLTPPRMNIVYPGGVIHFKALLKSGSPEEGIMEALRAIEDLWTSNGMSMHKELTRRLKVYFTSIRSQIDAGGGAQLQIQKGVPGTHAEVQSFNDALWAGDGDPILGVRRLKNYKTAESGEPFTRCYHCNEITRDVRAATDR